MKILFMIYKTLGFSLIFLLMSCLNSPVQYKEKSFSVSEQNIKTYCQKLEDFFPNYNCVKYFNKTFELTENEEIIQIELNKQKLNLIYKSESGKNEDLLETYHLIIEEL